MWQKIQSLWYNCVGWWQTYGVVDRQNNDYQQDEERMCNVSATSQRYTCAATVLDSQEEWINDEDCDYTENVD